MREMAAGEPSAGCRVQKSYETDRRNERGDFTGQGIPAIPALKKLVEFSPEKKEVETLWTHFIEEQVSA